MRVTHRHEASVRIFFSWHPDLQRHLWSPTKIGNLALGSSSLNSASDCMSFLFWGWSFHFIASAVEAQLTNLGFSPLLSVTVSFFLFFPPLLSLWSFPHVTSCPRFYYLTHNPSFFSIFLHFNFTCPSLSINSPLPCLYLFSLVFPFPPPTFFLSPLISLFSPSLFPP